MTAECELDKLQEHKGWAAVIWDSFSRGQKDKAKLLYEPAVEGGLTEKCNQNIKMVKWGVNVCKKTKAAWDNNKLISGGNYGL